MNMNPKDIIGPTSVLVGVCLVFYRRRCRYEQPDSRKDCSFKSENSG